MAKEHMTQKRSRSLASRRGRREIPPQPQYHLIVNINNKIYMSKDLQHIYDFNIQIMAAATGSACIPNRRAVANLGHFCPRRETHRQRQPARFGPLQWPISLAELLSKLLHKPLPLKVQFIAAA